MRLDALCGNDLATVFIIPKIKSYLICESQVALFVLLVRLLLQFIHQQIAKTLRGDNLMPASTPKEQEAVAETIENNIGKEIVERTQSNPKYYEKMSALLRELIEKRKNDVINYEEYLRQIVELARKVHKPESSTEYPPEIRESAAKRAFYDHLNGDTVVANQIYDAVMSSKQDNFRGSKIKERKIWRAIRAVVKDDQEADQQANWRRKTPKD